MTGSEYRAMVDADAAGDRRNRLQTMWGLVNGCEGCGACCGRVLEMTGTEARHLKAWCDEHGIVGIATADQMCALLDPDTHRCRAYAARPTVCRVWDSPTHAELVPVRAQTCGMRMDGWQMMATKRYALRDVDTWELLGVSLGRSRRG